MADMEETARLKQEIEHLRSVVAFEQNRNKPDVIAREMFDSWVVRVSVEMKKAADEVRACHAEGLF